MENRPRSFGSSSWTITSWSAAVRDLLEQEADTEVVGKAERHAAR